MNRIIIITGANNGIGLGLVRALAARNEHVACFDLNGGSLRHLEALFPETVRFYACDVTDPTQVKESVARAAKDFGPPDVLINNACITVYRPFDRTRIAEIRREFEVNYFGYLNMIGAVLPGMKARGSGLIYNVSSGVGLTGYPGLSGYTSTKGAIESFSRTLRMELEPYGISVSILHPPLTKTDSAQPLGIPPEMMADPEMVGAQLARKIGSRKAVLAADLATGLGLSLMRLFPEVMGGFLARMAARSRARTERPVQGAAHESSRLEPHR